MRIILASTSPRRNFLLKQMGVEFEAVPSDFEEYFDPDLTGEELVSEMALGKARAVALKNPDAVVIGSDSIVMLEGQQLGKPKNTEEAVERLRAYGHKAHQTISGAAVVCLNRNYERVGADVTNIRFKPMSDEHIKAYVATGDPLDKAGAYAFQHPMVLPFVDSIDGNLDNQVGFPTTLIAGFLRELGYDVKPLELTLEDFKDGAYSV